MRESNWAEGLRYGIVRGARMPRPPARVASKGRGRTRDQLYEEAKALGIAGRSKMTKDELQQVVDQKRGRVAS